MLSIPIFPESQHKIIESLTQYSDLDLVSLHQLHPKQGKFFAALFCRHGAIVYNVVQHTAQSPIQIDYLFAMAWREIFLALQRVQLSLHPETINWQNWLIDLTGHTLDRLEIPPPEQTRYSLTNAPPPLWCYVEQGLDRLPPLSRLIVVMNQNLNWNEQRISAYLHGEGEKIPATSIPQYLAVGYQQLEATLPQDIRDIYLTIESHNS
jgi:hypothetical protein